MNNSLAQTEVTTAIESSRRSNQYPEVTGASHTEVDAREAREAAEGAECADSRDEPASQEAERGPNKDGQTVAPTPKQVQHPSKR